MRTPAAYLRGIRHPEAFHGHGADAPFFEGWYIKLVSADLRRRWAMIPGVFRGVGDDEVRDEAFVQVLDGLTGRSWYHRFEADALVASDRAFEVAIGGNRFDATGVTLELPQLRGRLEYTSPLVPFPAPGIMGPYAYVPAMECFHGLVSLGHGLAGELEVEGVPASFDGGRGYIEKDWGRSFPAGYVWAASNHVDADPDASLVASVAIIPWRGRAFRGTIIAFRHGGRMHTWATWNRSRERMLTIDDSHVRWAVEGPHGVLELEAERVRGGLLHAPLRTAQHQRVEETLDARITFRHSDAAGRVLLEGSADCAGLEVFGDIPRLLQL